MAEQTIDNLKIEIEASAGSAIKVLEQLEKNMTNVKKAMGGFNTSGIDNLATKLTDVSTKLDKVSAKLDALQNKAKNVKVDVAPKVNTSSMDKAEREISRSLEKIQDKFARMGALGQAAMGGDSSAITSYQRQAVSLQGDIDVLEQKFKRLGDTTIRTDDFMKLENQIQTLDDKLKLLQEDYRNVTSGKVTMSDDQFIRLRSEISATKADIDSLKDKQRQMVDDGTANVIPFQKYREGLAALQGQFDATRQNVQAAADAMHNTDMAPNTEGATSRLEGLRSSAAKTVRELLKMSGSAIIKGIHSLGSIFDRVRSSVDGVKSGLGKLHGHLDKGFMKVLKYGFGIRSLYVGFRRLRKVVINSFGELQKSGAFVNTTRSNIEGLKASLSTLGFQFGAAFQPIFNAVAPALQTFINYLIQAMNVFSAFTAKLMGKDTYSRAVASSGAVAGNVGSAAKAAKELNKQLQGFDELNNLTTNDNSGGGGGGGSAGGGSGVTYVTEDVDSVLGDFGKELAELIKKGDWEGVGAAISDKIVEQLNKIPWDSIKEKAKDFGTNLGNFINGLINPELFSALGTTLGEAINTALEFGKALGETLNFDNLGESFASGINAFIKTNPLDLVVDNFNLWANGILDAIIAFLDKTDFKAIAEHIAEAIGKIDTEGIGWKVGKVVDGIVNALNDLLSNKSTWTNLGNKIADGINGFFKGVKGEDLAELLNNVTDALFTAITTAVKNIKWSEVGKDVAGFLGNLNVGTVALAIGAFSVVSGVAGKTLAALASSSIVSNLTTALAANAGTIASVGLKVGGVVLAMAAAATIGYEFGTTLGQFIAQWMKNQGIISGESADEYMAASEMTLKQKISDIKLAIEEGNFVDGWNKMWDDWMQPVFDEGKEIIVSIKEFGFKLAEGAKDFATSWSDYWETTLTPVFDKAVSVGIKIKDFGISMANGAKDFASAWTDFWGDKGEKAYDTVQAGVSLAKSGWTTVSAWVNAAAQKGTEVVSKVIDLAKGTWTSVGDWLKNNHLGQAVNKAIGLITGGWGSVGKWLNENHLGQAVNKAVGLAVGGWGSVGKWINDKHLGQAVNKAVGLTRSFAKGAKTVAAWLSANYMGKNPVKAGIALGKSGWVSVKGFLFGWPKKAANAVTATVSVGISLFKKGWNTLKSFFGFSSGGIIGANGAIKLFADGGVISKSMWNSLPKYASGTNNAHGSLFVAGENGPEIMGHINGRTEILNKSQIAATMYSAISRGMAQFRNAQMTSPSQLGFVGSVVNTMADSIASTNDTALVEEQNRLLAEQNRLLQQIANKNVTISSREVFNATRQEAQNYNNRTGNSPFLF